MRLDIFSLGAQPFTDQYMVAMFWSIFLSIMAVALIASVVIYILQSIGLYTIARRRGIKRPWLAWIPLGDFWIVGSISDHARLMKKGEVKNRRMLLLGLFGITTVVQNLLALESYELLWQFWELWQNADQMTFEELVIQLNAYEMQTQSEMLGFGVLLDLALSAAQITGLVFFYMSLWDLYDSCRPRQKVVFLVLSIIFGLQPFFIFACRKCDYGMQPQRPQLPQWPQQYPPQNPGWPPQDPPQWPPQNNT